MGGWRRRNRARTLGKALATCATYFTRTSLSLFHPPTHPLTHIEPTVAHSNHQLLLHPSTYPPTYPIHRRVRTGGGIGPKVVPTRECQMYRFDDPTQKEDRLFISTVSERRRGRRRRRRKRRVDHLSTHPYTTDSAPHLNRLLFLYPTHLPTHPPTHSRPLPSKASHTANISTSKPAG